ncbi:MAG: hypothetical protein JWL59_1103 [Chthoniobacteraceae bacterium]|nr:hypothetical protein [Chthoniobacteraceae bacterium]
MFRSRLKTGKPPRKTGLLAGTSMSLLLFSMLGVTAFAFSHLEFTGFTASLHGLTFVMVGITLASSSGSMLFNKDEADVLLHRPVHPRALLSAKVRVLAQVSIAMAVALNLCGFIVGSRAKLGGLLFIPVHLLSVSLEVIFCASFVALAYNLCLRWFGREKLENVMTTVQMVVAVGAMLAGQIVPRIIGQLDHSAFASPPVWLAVLPPVWFAALDAVLTGKNFSPSFLALAALGTCATVFTAWLGVIWMASTYEQGLVTLNEAGAGAVKSGAKRGRHVTALLNLPLVRLWLRDPVERAACRLTIVGMTRSRGVKLRVYPMLAQFMVMPLVFLGGGLRSSHIFSTIGPFAMAFAGSFIAVLPALLLDILRLSEDWHAADLFRQAPLPRPAALFHGTRKTIILLVCLPGMIVIAVAGFFLLKERSLLLLLLPGIIMIPALSLLPGLGELFLPFSQEPDVQIHKPRGCFMMMATMAICASIAGLSGWAWISNWFAWMLIGESLLVAIFVIVCNKKINDSNTNLRIEE